MHKTSMFIYRAQTNMVFHNNRKRHSLLPSIVSILMILLLASWGNQTASGQIDLKTDTRSVSVSGGFVQTPDNPGDYWYGYEEMPTYGNGVELSDQVGAQGV